jgi:hypothetical protein
MSAKTITNVIVHIALAFVAILAVAYPAMSQASDQDLVDQFYPPQLTADAAADFNNGGPEPSHFSDFIEADLNGTGRADFLIAAYTNGFSGVVRVLQKQGTSATLVAEPALPLIFSIYPHVSLQDLDNDGRPEIIVNFSAPTATSADWIFKWTGRSLNLFGPSLTDANGNVTTTLGDAVFHDLTGDGIPEILNPPERTFVDDPITVNQLVGGSYTLTTTKIYYLQTFVCTTGAPQTDTETFSIADPTASYVLIISNGDSSGTNRASSVQITLNGNGVAVPSQFNNQVQALQIPIAVSDSNSISVRFAGTPSSEMTIAIATQ